MSEHLGTNDMTGWLELQALDFGTDNQRERWLAQILPEDELTQLARAELFKVFGDTHRWKEIKKSEVTHKHMLVPGGPGGGTLRGHIRACCGCAPSAAKITFETAEVGELRHDEWENLKIVQQIAALAQKHAWLERSGGKVTVVSQTHWATCTTCQAEVCRSSAKVSIEWAGRILTREYAL